MSSRSPCRAHIARGHVSLLSFVWLFTLSSASCIRPTGSEFARSPSAIVVQRAGLYPETIAYDPRRDKFLLGSFRDGAVYAVESDGGVSRVLDDPRLCSVLGIALDASRNRLWVVSSDLGASVKPSAGGPKSVAQVGSYDLTTGTALYFVDLAPLAPGPHLANGIALDAAGSAYVSDSLSPSIYKIDAQGRASLFVQSERFAGEGINLNGLVVHPDGYLLVVKKSDGALFKVPLDQPASFSQVALNTKLVGGDGLTLVGNDRLIVIANQTPQFTANAAYALGSDDGWKSAKVRAVEKLEASYPTTAVLRGEQVYVVSSKLDELIQAPAQAKAGLRAQAKIQAIASLAHGQAASASGPAAIERTLLVHTDLSDQPGWESRLYLIYYPPGAEAQPHVHPVAAVGYVLEGRFESAFGDAAVTTTRAGESFTDLADAPHRVFRNPDRQRPLRFVIAGTFRKQDPLFRPVVMR